MHGVRVLLMHPEWSRSCDDCAKWLYRPDGTISKRAGLPVIRPPRTPTPCLSCPKIPAGEDKVRANAIEITPRNLKAFEHYMECRAVGQFPDDPIVRRNARIIRDVVDEADKTPLYKLIALLRLKGG